MRLLTSTDWPVRRGMMLAGLVAVGASLISMWLPPLGAFAIAAGLALTCLVPMLRRPVWLYIVAFAATFLCLGASYQQTTVLPASLALEQEDMIAATVVETPLSGHMVTVEIVQADRLPSGSRVLLYCNDQAMPARLDTVEAAVRYKALYSTQRSYRADGVFLQAYPLAYGEDAVRVTSNASAVRQHLLSVRGRLSSTIDRRLSSEVRALLIGICLGDKSGISAQTMEDFRASGLPHILVVSGLHLSVISTGVYAALHLFVGHRRLAAVLTMAVVVFFMLLIGFTPSVVRAGVMCLLLLGGQLFTCRADGLNSMGLALLLLLTDNPYCLLDVGLQLSFGAAGGVLCLTKPIQRCLYRLRLWKPIADSLAVTFAASLPITPLLGCYFGEVSVISPIANLLAVVPASVAMMLGWSAMLLALCPPLLFLSNGVLFLAGWLTQWLLCLVRFLGDLPFATVATDRAWIIVCLTGACGLSILCLYSRMSGMLRRLFAFLAALIVLAVGTDTRLRREATVVTAVSRGESAMVLVEQDGGCGLLAPCIEGLYTDAAFVRACNGELDYIVIGDGSAAHAARLTDWLKQVEVGRVLVVRDADWMIGLDVDATVLPAVGACELSSGTVLMLCADGSWRLTCHGADLEISSDMVPMDEYVYFTTHKSGEWSVGRWR